MLEKQHSFADVKYTYQYKTLPTTEQKLELNSWLRICQYWYNRQLGDRFDWWEENRSPVDACPLVTHLPELRDKPNYYGQKKYLPLLKKESVIVRWSQEELDLSRVPANTLQEVCKRVDLAFDNLKGLAKRNAPNQDENGAYLPNGQSAKSGLNLSWADAAFGQFFQLLRNIAKPLRCGGSPRCSKWREKAGAVVIEKHPAYTSQLLAYRDEFVFTDCSIREYWDDLEKLWVDRDINAAINLKRLGLDMFSSIKRRKGIPVVVGSIADNTSKEVLLVLNRTTEKPTPP